MVYTHRLATLEDAPAIAPLWKAFAEERESVDPSMQIQPNFDFEKYLYHQLEKPLSYCWVLEFADSEQPDQKTIIGCLCVYCYDEAPPPNLPEYLIQQHLTNPFRPRRVGSVLGFYIHPDHRQPDSIKMLVDAAMRQAEEMRVSDIDVLVAADQTGIQALVQRAGFTKAAVQYTRHYDIPEDSPLPSLHPPHPELPEVQLPEPGAIPLRDPATQKIISNAQGEPVFLRALRDADGKVILSSQNTPIYPTPLRDPETNNWVFDQSGSLVVCPLVWDDTGHVLEYQAIPQFHPPAYQFVNGKIALQQDVEGNYIFCDLERDQGGKILRSPEGMPVFKQFVSR